MSALDKFKERYRGLGRIRIYVPEIDLDIWSKPYTLHDEIELTEKMGGLDTPASFAALIIRKGEDENGNKLFQPGDEIELVRIAEAGVLKAIAFRIIGSDSDAQSEASAAEK